LAADFAVFGGALDREVLALLVDPAATAVRGLVFFALLELGLADLGELGRDEDEVVLALASFLAFLAAELDASLGLEGLDVARFAELVFPVGLVLRERCDFLLTTSVLSVFCARRTAPHWPDSNTDVLDAEERKTREAPQPKSMKPWGLRADPREQSDEVAATRLHRLPETRNTRVLGVTPVWPAVEKSGSLSRRRSRFE
jgi:hypothetical protein